MESKIRVLLADDQPISREGIQRILGQEKDIELVSVVRTASEVLLEVREKAPDVVLLDLKWHGDVQAMDEVIREIRQDFPKIQVVAISIYEPLLQRAKEAGAAWGVSKNIDKNELPRLIRGAYASAVVRVAPHELQKARSALRRLRNLAPGRDYAAHEEAVLTVLKTALCPHLTNPRCQTSTMSGSRRRDILFSNYSTHVFWQRLGQRHDATQIVFELKNVKKLRVSYIDQLAGYLTPGLGRLGFIVGRNQAEEHVIQRAIDVFHADSKVIIFLCDEDLECMLSTKEEGGDPTKRIREKYDEFITWT